MPRHLCLAILACATACAPPAPIPTKQARPEPSASFEGEIEYEMLDNGTLPKEQRRDVLRAKGPNVVTAACLMNVGCGHQVVDRTKNKLFILLNEPKVYIEHDLSELATMRKEMTAPRDAAPPADPREWTKIEETNVTATVATLPCREVVMTTGYGGRWEACATRAREFADLIRFFSETSATGSHIFVNFPEYARAGWLPLRVRFPATHAEVVAVRVARHPVADSVFEVPPGYPRAN